MSKLWLLVISIYVVLNGLARAGVIAVQDNSLFWGWFWVASGSCMALWVIFTKDLKWW